MELLYWGLVTDGDNPWQIHTVFVRGAAVVPSAVYPVMELVTHDLENIYIKFRSEIPGVPLG